MGAGNQSRSWRPKKKGGGRMMEGGKKERREGGSKKGKKEEKIRNERIIKMLEDKFGIYCTCIKVWDAI